MPRPTRLAASTSDKAKAALAKSKYADKAEFECLVPSIPYLFDAKDAAVVMQSQLAKAGITMKITPMEQPQILTRALAGNQVASLLPLMAPSDPTFIIQILLHGQPADVAILRLYQSRARCAAPRELQIHRQRPTGSACSRRSRPCSSRIVPTSSSASSAVANAWRANVKNFKPNTGLTMWVRDVELG